MQVISVPNFLLSLFELKVSSAQQNCHAISFEAQTLFVAVPKSPEYPGAGS